VVYRALAYVCVCVFVCLRLGDSMFDGIFFVCGCACRVCVCVCVCSARVCVYVCVYVCVFVCVCCV